VHVLEILRIGIRQNPVRSRALTTSVASVEASKQVTYGLLMLLKTVNVWNFLRRLQGSALPHQAKHERVGSCLSIRHHVAVQLFEIIASYLKHTAVLIA
jgi:hypothetical protein